MLVDDITLDGLRRLVENLAITNRPPQFDVLRMSPDQWTGRAGWLAAKQFEGGNIGRVPYLLGQQTALSRRGIFHYGEQGFGFIAVPGGQSIMGALSCEQRPGTANAGAIEGGTIFVFAIPVAVIAIPAWTLRKLDRQQSINRAQC